MTEARPSVSVVLVVGNQRARGARALASVLAQEALSEAEVLLVDAGRSEHPPLPDSDQPVVRVIRPADRPSFGELRAAGVREARAPLVAFLEEHSEALPGWLAAIRRALEGPYAGAGGEVHNLNPGVGVSDGAWLTGYWRWHPPTTWREASIIPGHNSAYRRDLLLAYGAELGRVLQADVRLGWLLRGNGHRLVIDPAIKFAHGHTTTLYETCRGFYLWDRCFGHQRATGWSWPRRVLRAGVAMLSPIKRLAQLFWHLLRSRPRALATYFRHLPTIAAGSCCSAAGLIAGILAGEGDAPRKFLEIELDALR